jgi:hypothetical protein
MLPGRHLFIHLGKISPSGRNDKAALRKRENVAHVTIKDGLPSYHYSFTPVLHHSIPPRSHIKENRLVLTLQPDIEMIDGLTIPLFSCGDERRSPSFVLDEL